MGIIRNNSQKTNENNSWNVGKNSKEIGLTYDSPKLQRDIKTSSMSIPSDWL